MSDFKEFSKFLSRIRGPAQATVGLSMATVLLVTPPWAYGDDHFLELPVGNLAGRDGHRIHSVTVVLLLHHRPF